MKTLTINQIILLLEVYRGFAHTDCGTYEDDIVILQSRRLIDNNLDITTNGKYLCELFKLTTGK
jgi:hypothetical protein